MSNKGLVQLGGVNVIATQGRGLNADEITERCVAKIVHVSDQAPPVIRDQARAYQGQVATIIGASVRQAVQSDRTTVIAALERAGHFEAANVIRGL